MTAPLRPVALPATVPGQLMLSAMPGRFDPLADFVHAARAADIARVACLTAPEEIATISPDYAAARASGNLPFTVVDHPVHDLGVPADAAAFDTFVAGLAEALQGGETVAIHCAAGIGRTGMAAQRVLQALGLDATEAATRVLDAGSQPETAVQRRFLAGDDA